MQHLYDIILANTLTYMYTYVFYMWQNVFDLIEGYNIIKTDKII